MFQEFRTHVFSITVLFPILDSCICFFVIKALMPAFPDIALQRFDFKNSIIAIKLFLFMI